jgi:hypothetical protein
MNEGESVCTTLRVGSLLFLVLYCAGANGGESVPSLIEKLGSPDFKTREAATKALLERPDAEDALRAALRSKDLEFRRRAEPIVDNLEWLRIPRELDKAIEEGRLERAIELIARWPQGKNEGALWDKTKALTVALIERNNQARKSSGDGADLRGLQKFRDPRVTLRVKQFSERTEDPEIAGGSFFVRAEAVDHDRYRGQKLPRKTGLLAVNSLAVSSGPARFVQAAIIHSTIFAKGPVMIERHIVTGSIIVCCADVTLDSCVVDNCLIIAKGSVDIRSDIRNSKGQTCRIIAGKSVTYDKEKIIRSIITENEPSPLGYIRWSDAPKEKEKAAPKSK